MTNQKLKPRPYGDSLMVFTMNAYDAQMIPRLFINPYENSNHANATFEIDRMANLFGNPKDPMDLRKSLYDLFMEHHRRGHDYVRSIVETSLVDTEHHSSSSPKARPFNIVTVDLSVIPADAVDTIPMEKLALIPSSLETDMSDAQSTTSKAFPKCDRFIYHHGSQPELYSTARAYMKTLGFAV